MLFFKVNIYVGMCGKKHIAFVKLIFEAMPRVGYAMENDSCFHVFGF